MSIFSKPLTQFVTADVQELLDEQAVENVGLEFKSRVPEKDETLKKLSSFANSFGGFMVIGAKANSADGRIESLPGVDEQPGYKQKVVQWCFDAVSPPLIVEVSDAIPSPGSTGKFCYIIYTAESEVAPHFLNGRKGVWVRTDEFSQRFEPQLATENELRYLLNRRQLTLDRRTEVVQRSRRRFEKVVSRT
ncbi:MAG: ATP-binding protein [Terriglobia bacterium]|jgi:predicted HTH transcriptional regulator